MILNYIHLFFGTDHEPELSRRRRCRYTGLLCPRSRRGSNWAATANRHGSTAAHSWGKWCKGGRVEHRIQQEKGTRRSLQQHLDLNGFYSSSYAAWVSPSDKKVTHFGQILKREYVQQWKLVLSFGWLSIIVMTIYTNKKAKVCVMLHILESVAFALGLSLRASGSIILSITQSSAKDPTAPTRVPNFRFHRVAVSVKRCNPPCGAARKTQSQALIEVVRY